MKPWTSLRGSVCGDYEAATLVVRAPPGSEPAFAAHETECVWELGDSDGNEIGFGGAPLVGSAD